MAVAQQTQAAAAQSRAVPIKRRRNTGAIVVNVVLALICIIWTVPTIGLLVSSFRTREDISTTGWWSVIPHPEWVTSSTINLQSGLALDKPIQLTGLLAGTTVTDDQLVKGVNLPNGQHVKWANRRSRTVAVQDRQLASNANLNLTNYQN